MPALVESSETFAVPLDFDSHLSTKLARRELDSDHVWDVWEHKTLNIHRGVLHWRAGKTSVSFAEMADTVRKRINREFRTSWWRGFAFGVIIEATDLPPDIGEIEIPVQTRALIGPVWQWTIFACEPRAVAVGVHTWQEGYLTPVYRSVLAEYGQAGWLVGRFTKEKDKLMQFLTTVAKLNDLGLMER